MLLLARPQSIIAHTGASVRSLPLSTSWLLLQPIDLASLARVAVAVAVAVLTIACSLEVLDIPGLDRDAGSETCTAQQRRCDDKHIAAQHCTAMRREHSAKSSVVRRRESVVLPLAVRKSATAAAIGSNITRCDGAAIPPQLAVTVSPYVAAA